MDKLSELEEQVLKETKSADGLLLIVNASKHSKTEEEYNKKLKEELEKYKKIID